MFCKCEKGIKSKEIHYKTGALIEAYILCGLNGKYERISAKECRRCVFYPFEVKEKKWKNKK